MSHIRLVYKKIQDLDIDSITKIHTSITSVLLSLLLSNDPVDVDTKNKVVVLEESLQKNPLYWRSILQQLQSGNLEDRNFIPTLRDNGMAGYLEIFWLIRMWVNDAIRFVQWYKDVYEQSFIAKNDNIPFPQETWKGIWVVNWWNWTDS